MQTLDDERPEDFTEILHCPCGASGPADELEEDGLCPVCGHDLTEEEDYEPGGEAFRGGEAAAYQSERMRDAQRYK